MSFSLNPSLMKKLELKLLIFLLPLFSSTSGVLAIESEYIQGVSEKQWQTISKIGDPLDCKTRIEKLSQMNKGKVVTHEDFLDDPWAINRLIRENKIVTLESGEYQIKQTIQIPNGHTLIGQNDTIINASRVSIGIRNFGNVTNLTVYQAQNHGIELESYSNVYRVVVKNTGINAPSNSSGEGVHSSGVFSHSNCVVSVEASHGYNETGSSKISRLGGNADGFTVKYGAHNITFIDAHAHHNSDDGFDFWKGGAGAKIEANKPTIRIFYSSANKNGKNPLTPNGDGSGFKFGSWDKYQTSRGKDFGQRLIYGSAACWNKYFGFDWNRTSTKIIAKNLNAVGNSRGYDKVPNFNRQQDPNNVTCDLFPSK